jgi:hypothetical protein
VQHDAHHVALADAQALEAACDAAHRFVELARRDLAIPEP